jgi:VWFA-related protein
MRRSRTRRLVRVLAVALVGVFLLQAAAVAKDKKKDGPEKVRLKEAIAQLPFRYQAWLEEVAILITREETETFVGLAEDYQRDAFIEAFWRSRDTQRDTGFNEFRDRYMRLLEEARLRFETLDEDRARILLLNGLPAAMLDVRCASVLWPAQVWFYPGTERQRGNFALVFYRRGGAGRYRVWRPDDGVDDLVQFAQINSSNGENLRLIYDKCPSEEADALVSAVNMALTLGPFEFEVLLSKLTSRPEVMSKEWLPTFNAYSTGVPEEAESFSAEIDFQFPGRRQSRTLVQGIVSVPVEEVTVADLVDVGEQDEGYNFVMIGEVLQGGKLFDSFRYSFNIPASELRGETLPLIFERYLRPGDYRLALKVEDLNGDAFWRTSQELSVPRVDRSAPVVLDEATAAILAEANAEIDTHDNGIELIRPRGEYQSGYMRINTKTTGPDIAQVAFSLDGNELLRKKRPPYSVDLDLGELPRMRTLVATAYDAEGRQIARDELQINAGSHRFAVRLIEPRRGERYTRSLRAEAQVSVPEGEAIERVEFYLNETLLATLYQEPWVQPILLPEDSELAYVRVVAVRTGGNTTEDVVFVNAPDYMEELDIQFVELYIAAVDKDLHPVMDLDRSDFRVLEDGVEQTPARFETVGDLPIHAGVMVDASASMEESLNMAQEAAIDFLQKTITPKDRATLVTFNDRPHLAVKFTNDIQRLAGGLAGLKAERGTALYDSLIFALYYFNGVKGQQALILLSDGKDESSRFTFEQALEYARRAGVAIYTIGLDLPRKDGGAKKKLTRFAAETGGRSFFIKDAAELAAIYETIQQEIRSRYYLSYQSNNGTGDTAFRTVAVEVARPGVEAKTLRGYYP